MDDMTILYIICFWIGGILICGVTGTNKRIGFLAAAAVALFFSPVIGIIVAMLSKDNEDIEREKEILQLFR